MYKLLSVIIAGLFLSVGMVAQNIQEGQQPFRKKESANALYLTIEGQQKNIEHILEEKFNSKAKCKTVAVGETAKVKPIKLLHFDLITFKLPCNCN